jgi:hypothetical protein
VIAFSFVLSFGESKERTMLFYKKMNIKKLLASKNHKRFQATRSAE